MELKSKKGISGAAIKWVALASMLIDHIGAVLIEEGLWNVQPFSPSLYLFDIALRTVGRIAFPLYCFLIVEGFFHTRSRWRYLLRLLAFGVLSEIPFDLAFNHRLLDWSYQNVYFTLGLGFISIWIWEALAKGENPRLVPFWRGFGAMAAFIIAMGIAYAGHTDYGAGGVLLIVMLYAEKDAGWVLDLFVMAALGVLLLFGSHWIELLGGLGLILIHLYNGERGRQPKWLFYSFYPAHLALLALARFFIWGKI